jgi:6-pyruvoyltetrahydropterin/6-carboxytetrahydropterin synthase
MTGAAILPRPGTFHRPSGPPLAMPRMRLTRRVRFSAAHRYHRPDWSDERNQAVFGPCANPHGHGHDYLLEATVEGEVDPETGFSADLAALDGALRRAVEPLDHQHLNHVVPEFAPGGMIPTCESLLLLLWPGIEAAVRPARLVGLALDEGPDLRVEYDGA